MNLFGDILSYAYQGGGKYILIICVVLSVVADIASFAPIVGLIAYLVLSAYFCAVYFQIMESSASGGSEAPEFPEVTNIFEDMIWPLLQVGVVLMVSFGPLLGSSLFVSEKDYSELVAFGLVGWGVIYAPMGMLAVVMLGYMGALGPHIVLPAIFRAGWIYWMGVVMLILLYGLSTVIFDALSGMLIVRTLIMALVSSYILMTNARILGVVFRERQEELNWF